MSDIVSIPTMHKERFNLSLVAPGVVQICLLGPNGGLKMITRIPLTDLEGAVKELRDKG